MGMMKKYKSSRSWKMLEAVVKFLVTGIRDMVLETISVYYLDPKDLEALLNAISKRLSGRLCKRLVGRLYKRFGRKLFRRFGNWYMFKTEGRFKAIGSFGTSGSSVDRLLTSVTNMSIRTVKHAMVEMSSLGENQTWFFGQATSRKPKVKRWMFKGEKAFSHVNFDEYICVALSEGLLIAGKEDPTFVETLYRWVVGFDEIIKLKRCFFFLKRILQWEPWEASLWERWGFPIRVGCGFDIPYQGLKKVI
ncbi:hypothetical protein Tco_1465458 [Tanacetum coccineum]